MNPYDNIEAYINGQLSAEDLKIMEAAIAKDEKLQLLIQEYDGVKKVSEGLLEEELLSMVKGVDRKTRLSSTRRRWWLIGLIGVMVIVGGYYTFQYMQKQNRINQAIALYDRPENRDIVRSEDPETLDFLARGKYYFELNRFEDSEKSLLKLLEETSNQDTISQTNYWLGHVYFNMQEWEKAREVLDLTSDKESLKLLDILDIIGE